MFRFFERLVDPYPEATPDTPPRGFFAFLWACSKGLRGYLLATTLLTAVIGAFEALLFSMMGSIVDWLAQGAAGASSGRRRAGACCCWPACSPAASC